MKNILSFALCLLCAVFLLMALPTEAEAEIYKDTVRLHILAASDSEEDQAVKLAVRDRLLADYGAILSDVTDVQTAKETLSEELPEMEASVRTYLSDMNVAYDVSVTLTEETYGERTYEGFSLPGGTYASLRVILGEGEGHNWWCVMFPPLCLGLCEGTPLPPETVYSHEEIRLIEGEPYAIKFKLLQTVSGLFSGE